MPLRRRMIPMCTPLICTPLVCALLFVAPTVAQELRGTIDGVVRDASGAILPGVTIEARSAGGGVWSTVTDGNGIYRFPSVLPGTYEVTATLAGFKPAKVTDAVVTLGGIKTIDFSLGPADVAEAVYVTAESPVIY